jgi:hypothetical protein
MKWAGHVALMWEKRNTYWVLVGKPEERDHSENLRVDCRIMLKRFLRK